MGDDQRYWYSARDVRKAVQEASPEQVPRGLLIGFQSFVVHDDAARARLAANHPKRLRLLDRADNLPHTMRQDLMHLRPENIFTSRARGVLIYPRRLETVDRAKMANQAEAALQLVRFLTLLALASGRTHPFMVLLVLSQFLDEKRMSQDLATWPTPQSRPARVMKPPGQLVLAEPRLARAPNVARPSSPCAARTVPGCVRLGGAL